MLSQCLATKWNLIPDRALLGGNASRPGCSGLNRSGRPAIGDLIRTGDLDHAARAGMDRQTKTVKLDDRGHKIEAETESRCAFLFV